jgi:hypothetical protein
MDTPAVTSEPGRWIRFGIRVLAAVPVAAGTTRRVELVGGPSVLPVNPRFVASPAPAIIHITGGALHLLAGIVQFSAAIRRRWPTGRVRVGRFLPLLCLIPAASALWMALCYPREVGTGRLRYVFRLAFGISVAACLVLGVAAVRRRILGGHRAWTMRAYPPAADAGTRVFFTRGFAEGVVGDVELSSGLAFGAGSVVNLAVVEHALGCRKAAPSRPAPTMVRF